MCEDHELSRRAFLGGASTLAVAAAIPPAFRHRQDAGEHLQRSLVRPHSTEGANAYSMAMHVHSSFSEMAGSMDAQLYQATANAVDVLWWTDHADRMGGSPDSTPEGYRTAIHFTSLTAEPAPAGEGKPWHWIAKISGSPASKSGQIDLSVISPNDPAGGSLQVQCQAQPGLTAAYGFYANCQTSTQPAYNYRCNLVGQSLSIDVNPDAGWSLGWLEILITTSRHEAAGGNTAGTYSLSYRIVSGTAPPATANGRQGIVWISVPAGQFTTVTLMPDSDLAALFPMIDYRDCGLYELQLNAVSTGDSVSGYFGYLRLSRTSTGSVALSQQQQMMASLQPSYSLVQQWQGLEVSWRDPHLNWFGQSVPFPTLTDSSGREYGPTGWVNYLWQILVPQVHTNSGLVSYNHPFGTKALPAYPSATQDSMLASVATSMLGGNGVPPALGCDIIEAGYPLRGGVNLAHHLALWDIMSRNAIFLTATGVNDDHQGVNWYEEPNNWYSTVYANSAQIPDLLSGLAAGQAWMASLRGFAPNVTSLDLNLDGSCPMGSVSLSSLTSRQLTVNATGLPLNGSLQVLQGAVDYAGTNGLSSDVTQIASYPAPPSGVPLTQTLSVDTSTSSFYRTAVLDGSANVVAASNPVWSLQSAPPNGIPAAREC